MLTGGPRRRHLAGALPHDGAGELAARLAELWPSDQYTAIIAETERQDRPPGTEGRG